MGALTTLFDTSALIGPTDGPPPTLPGDSAVSVVAVGELYAGVLLTRHEATQSRRLRLVADVLAEVTILEIDRAVATAYGDLRAVSGRMQSNDLWIAATALAHDLTLLTRDERQAALLLVRTRLV
ncbi:MAG TPA: type II toxin-antitoxin system VapC family toxin [Solirubrobacteraceae bacterium]|jgi:predicted nucleic acid-binding protein|nr:type II toxin-antitoxin system VapC family toxin [Solirubrobacteraceae bacterium]